MTISANDIVVCYSHGVVTGTCRNGQAFSFPVKGNRRLRDASEEALSNIRISPSGLHWPDLDEDLSFVGLLQGDYGQHV